MREPIDVDPDRFRAVAQLLADFPDLDTARLRTLLEAPTARRRRVEPIRPRSWSEITAAVDNGWVNKSEARKFAGLTQRSAPTRKPAVKGRV